MKLTVKRCYIYSVFDKETGIQVSYDCARREEAIEEMKRIKQKCCRKCGELKEHLIHDIDALYGKADYHEFESRGGKNVHNGKTRGDV